MPADTREVETVGFTKGPWHVGRGGIQHANRVWTTDMRPVVNLCSMGISPADIDAEAQANAHLIAAAPELYEALKELLGSLYIPFPESETRPTVLKARSALLKAKATGGDIG